MAIAWRRGKPTIADVDPTNGLDEKVRAFTDDELVAYFAEMTGLSAAPSGPVLVAALHRLADLGVSEHPRATDSFTTAWRAARAGARERLGLPPV